MQEQGVLGPGQTPDSFASLRLHTGLAHPGASLEEIYEAIPQSTYRCDSSRLVAQEYEIERALCFLNPEVVSLIRQAREQGLRVIFTSQSALGEARLRQLLEEKAPGLGLPDAFYMGCDKEKKDMTGLLALVQEDFSLPPEACLHIGLESRPQKTAALFINLFYDDPVLAREHPVFWNERSRLFAAPFGDLGLSWLRTAFAQKKMDEIEEALVPFYLYGARVLGPLLSGLAAWASARLKQEKAKCFTPASPSDLFWIDLISLFAPEITISEDSFYKVALDDLSPLPSPSHLLCLVSGAASFSLQKNGHIVEGFLAQNKNPYDLAEAFVAEGHLLKAFCCQNSPFLEKQIAAVRQGVFAFAEAFIGSSASAFDPALFLSSHWKNQMSACARRALFSPTPEEERWTKNPSNQVNHPSPRDADVLLPEEEERLRRLADQAFAESLQAGFFDFNQWRQVLMQPSVAARRFVCAHLAPKMKESGQEGLSTDLLRLLWLLGNRNYKIFKSLWPLHRTERPTMQTWLFLREALVAADELGDINYVLEAQNYSHSMMGRSYQLHDKGVPFQDSLIIKAVLKAVTPFRPALKFQAPAENRPLRLCYIMGGEAAQTYHSVFDAVFALACAHDPRQVEISFASIQFEDVCRTSARTCAWIEKARPLCKKFHYRTRGLSYADSLIKLSAELAEENYDALVFSAVTNARLPLAALRPAPLMVGLGYGRINVYTSPLLDFTAHIVDYPTVSSLCPAYRLADYMPEDRFRIPERPIPKQDLGIPHDAPLVICSGRPVKYRSLLHWQVVAHILEARPQVHFAIVGPIFEDVKEWAEPYLPKPLLSRVHFLGRREDHAEVLSCADILLDTIPMGGGFNLTEAMHLGLPVVICHNRAEDLFAPYENDRLLPIGEIFTDPGYSFSWDDLAGIQKAVIRLLDDPAERAALSPKLREIAARRRNIGKTAEAFEKLIREQLALCASSP